MVCVHVSVDDKAQVETKLVDHGKVTILLLQDRVDEESLGLSSSSKAAQNPLEAALVENV